VGSLLEAHSSLLYFSLLFSSLLTLTTTPTPHLHPTHTPFARRAWVRDDRPSFKALQGGLLVAPILQKLILNREPRRVLEWADKVAAWPFKRIIPCHLANDVKADGRAFRRAFGFLERRSFWSKGVPTGDARDVELLSAASKSLTEQGVLFPEADLV